MIHRNKKEINIIITGDFCPHKRIEQAFLKKEFENVFSGFEKIAKNCDLSITNLECPHESPFRKPRVSINCFFIYFNAASCGELAQKREIKIES